MSAEARLPAAPQDQHLLDLAFVLVVTVLVWWARPRYFPEQEEIFCVGVVTFAIFLVRFVRSLGEMVAVPYLMLFNFYFQHFLCAMVLYYFPPFVTYDIGQENYGAYLGYAVPACFAMAIGAFVALRGKTRKYREYDLRRGVPVWARYAREIFFFGMVITMVNSLVHLPVAFFWLLLSLLRYVGIFALMLQRDRLWPWFAAISLVPEVVSASDHALFHQLVLYLGSLFLVLSFMKGWAKRGVVVILASMVFMIFFQNVKFAFRAITWNSEKQYSAMQKVEILSETMLKSYSTFTLMDEDIVAFALMRFNEGWIVNRVIQRVPAEEPYAHGATIATGLYCALVPRLFDMHKPEAGGQVHMRRFAGYQIGNDVSMGIGVLGEMYANFGKWGGVAGCGIYSYLLCLLFAQLRRKALENPVWWAWAPYVGLWAMKGEEGLMEATTWVMKSMVIMWGVLFVTRELARRKEIAARGAVSVQCPSGSP